MAEERSLLRERLVWVDNMRRGLMLVLGDDVMDTVHVHPSTDPLKAIFKIPLRESLTQASREPLRTYIRAWAETANCEVPRIDITDRYVQAEVLIKHRIWKEGMEDFGSKKKPFANKGWNRGLGKPKVKR